VFGPCGASDEQLRRLAFDDVPDDIAWRWPGSYTVVRLLPGQTTVWTDLGWSWPIYTVDDGDSTVWASSSLLLASLKGCLPDLDQLRARLQGPKSAEAAIERSYFTGVSRVPPGHRLTIGNDGHTRVTTVWKPASFKGSPSAALRAELESAVEVRLSAGVPVSSDLSGGFDSTALTLIAGERLQARGDSVLGVTTHPNGVRHGGDLDFAHEAGRGRGVHHVWLPMGPGEAPYQRMDELPSTDEPPPSAVSHAYLTKQLRWSRQTHGRELHMTGDGGDGLLLTRPAHLIDLARHGMLGRAIRETALWAHVRQSSWREVITEATTPPDGALHQKFELRTRNQRATVDALLTAGRTARADGQLARTCGVNLHNPYFDSRLVDLCLSMPPRQLPGPARYKPIMATAMRDLFPARLTERATKGDACPDHFGGLRRALPDIRRLMRGHVADLGLLDPKRFDRLLGETAAGIRSELYPVEAAVSLEAWLCALDRHTPVSWTRHVVGEHV
jgi:asparagine synthase (glutamine-hydrolysing)